MGSRQRFVALLAAGAALCAVAGRARAWNMTDGGVWDVPGARRVPWNPTNGGIGNMGNTGLPIHIAAPPEGTQSGAVNAVNGATGTWEFGSGNNPPVRIKFAAPGAEGSAKAKVSWGNAGGAPGEVDPMGTANFNAQTMTLDSVRTRRADGWSLDFTGIGTREGTIDEYDVATVAVHEWGHIVGLSHPPGKNQLMTPQDESRMTNGYFWRSVEQMTPFGGQPMKLGGGALPDGAFAYRDPRNSVSGDDVTGAATLYSAPIAKITAATADQGGGVKRYTYTAMNDSSRRPDGGFAADYQVREVVIPISPGVTIGNLMLAGESQNFTVTRMGDRIIAKVRPDPGGSGDLVGFDPGKSLQIIFDSSDPMTHTQPETRWMSRGFQSGGGAAPDGFDPLDYPVQGGNHNYRFNAAMDKWEMFQFPLVVAPVPTPCTTAMLGAALLACCPRRRRP